MRIVIQFNIPQIKREVTFNFVNTYHRLDVYSITELEIIFIARIYNGNATSVHRINLSIRNLRQVAMLIASGFAAERRGNATWREMQPAR